MIKIVNQSPGKISSNLEASTVFVLSYYVGIKLYYFSHVDIDVIRGHDYVGRFTATFSSKEEAALRTRSIREVSNQIAFYTEEVIVLK